MTLEEKKEKLEQELLAIPVEKWSEFKPKYNGFKTKHNGFDIQLSRNHNGFTPSFYIGGYELYSKNAHPLLDALEKRENDIKLDEESRQLDYFLGLKTPPK